MPNGQEADYAYLRALRGTGRPAVPAYETEWERTETAFDREVTRVRDWIATHPGSEKLSPESLAFIRVLQTDPTGKYVYTGTERMIGQPVPVDELVAFLGTPQGEDWRAKQGVPEFAVGGAFKTGEPMVLYNLPSDLASWLRAGRPEWYTPEGGYPITPEDIAQIQQTRAREEAERTYPFLPETQERLRGIFETELPRYAPSPAMQQYFGGMFAPIYQEFGRAYAQRKLGETPEQSWREFLKGYSWLEKYPRRPSAEQFAPLTRWLT